MQDFYALDFKHINFRAHPEMYRVGRGEQGVLLVEPYKSEILPLWRFKTPEIARESAKAIYEKFLEYKMSRDFVGMDMARKYLQMGFTRARRYANHPSGRKYDKETHTELPRGYDPEKAKASSIFYSYYERVRRDRVYRALRLHHKIHYGVA